MTHNADCFFATQHNDLSIFGLQRYKGLNNRKCVIKYVVYSVSQPFFPRGILGQLSKYLASPLVAKIGLKVNKSDNC